MMPRYLDPTNDVAFKKIFSDKERLKDFLNAVLRLEEGVKIKELAFIPQEELPDFKVGRRSILDIKCLDQEGNSYVVEMQNRPEEAFLNRVQCYASHAYVSQAIKGATHGGLMPVILLALTKHKIFEHEVDCISYHWTVESKTQKRYLFALSYVFIELPKFIKSPEELQNGEDEWLYFFAKGQESKAPPAQIKDPLVLDAYKTVEQFNWTEAEYDAYFRARLAAEAEELILKKSYEEGKEEGKAEGKAEGRIEGEQKKLAEVVYLMKEEGLSLEMIQKITSLSLPEIENILKK